jgi:D-Tyr-tRNAtyr deacylase
MEKNQTYKGWQISGSRPQFFAVNERPRSKALYAKTIKELKQKIDDAEIQENVPVSWGEHGRIAL